MSHQELSFSSLLGLRSLYVVTYGWLYGMSIWVTFFGGIIAYRALPRQQFGNLQHRTFPTYFSLSIGLASILLSSWVYTHPTVAEKYTQPTLFDVAQAYTLTGVIAMQASNHLIIGPLTSKTMFQRHKLEKAEGKGYDEAGVSKEMKKINARFGALHGISSLANLGAVLLLTFHGLCLGSRA